MAALQTVQNPRSLHLIVETRDSLKILSLQGKEVSFFWIKAHIGLEGNERADELAKVAPLGSKRRPDYDLCSVSFVKGCTRNATLGGWNIRYSKGTTASVTKMFLPDAKTARRVVKKFGATSVRPQFMTGHGGFSEYLNRFRCNESPACMCDPKTSESVQHSLLECSMHAKEC